MSLDNIILNKLPNGIGVIFVSNNNLILAILKEEEGKYPEWQELLVVPKSMSLDVINEENGIIAISKDNDQKHFFKLRIQTECNKHKDNHFAEYIGTGDRYIIDSENCPRISCNGRTQKAGSRNVKIKDTQQLLRAKGCIISEFKFDRTPVIICGQNSIKTKRIPKLT